MYEKFKEPIEVYKEIIKFTKYVPPINNIYDLTSNQKIKKRVKNMTLGK